MFSLIPGVESSLKLALLSELWSCFSSLTSLLECLSDTMSTVKWILIVNVATGVFEGFYVNCYMDLQDTMLIVKHNFDYQLFLVGFYPSQLFISFSLASLSTVKYFLSVSMSTVKWIFSFSCQLYSAFSVVFCLIRLWIRLSNVKRISNVVVRQISNQLRQIGSFLPF
jgi:hypothetical protein